MVTIEVLGPGCDNCKRLEKHARETVAMAGIQAEVIKIIDYREIMARGVMSTPGLIIDSKVMSVGRIPPAGDIPMWLSQDGTWPTTSGEIAQ